MKKILFGFVVSALLLARTSARAESLQQEESGDGVTAAVASQAYESSNADYVYWVSNGAVEITRYKGQGGVVAIPETIDDMPVASIGAYAFYDDPHACTYVTDLTIPGSVRSIKTGAFRGCQSLNSVSLEDGLISIGDNAFETCPLNDVTIPDSVTGIGKYAFSSCPNLTTVILGDGVAAIGESAFRFSMALTSAVIGNSVDSIGDYAFYDTSLSSITIPGSVAAIGDYAFAATFSLMTAYFLGGAPSMGASVFMDSPFDFTVCYTSGASGFTTPTWEGYPAEPCADDPPALGTGPYVAAGAWPLMSATQASPTYLSQNYFVLWTFSDDYAFCPDGECTHGAQYSVAGSGIWEDLSVSSDAEAGYAYVELPIASLQNATTYAFRYTVRDCASQSTHSGEYYFRVATSDAPPVITGGPWLAAGSWPALPTSQAKAFMLNQDSYVLWTFDDDYASCAGLCTHRARYRKVGDTAWTWISVSTDPDGDWYAYITLPVESLDAGTYQFYFDVRDCAGQRTSAPKVYYFKVE